MRTGGRSSFGAAKLLLERGWLDDKNASKAKEKLKAKEDEELNQQALSLLLLQNDETAELVDTLEQVRSFQPDPAPDAVTVSVDTTLYTFRG
jgi:hypothetical protein